MGQFEDQATNKLIAALEEYYMKTQAQHREEDTSQNATLN